VKISIVVPAFNEEKFLAETLAQIKSASSAFTNAGWDTELIVCDNHSTDRTAEIARAAGATVVFEPVNQISRARNTGAAAATGDWLAFVDADSHPSAELFADLIREIRSGNCIGGGALFRWDHNTLNTRLWMPILNAGFRWRRMCNGPFMFAERAVFKEIGGFNPEIFFGEDLELGSRLEKVAREMGKQFVILHRHPIVTSARRFPEYSVLTPVKVLYHILFKPTVFTANRQQARRWYDGSRRD